MADKRFIKFLFFFIILSFLTVCCSGTSVGFSFDARRTSRTSSAISAISFLKTNQVFSSQIRVLVADHKVLDTFSNTGIPVDLYLTQTEIMNLGKSKASLSLWLRTHHIPFHPYLNFTSIIVGTSSSSSVAQKQLPFLLPTLNSMHLALKSLNLDHQVKVSVGFSLSVLKHLQRKNTRDLCRTMDFIQKHKSFVMVETDIDGDLSMEDQFIGLIIKSASSAATTLHCSDASMVLNAKSSVIPSSIEVLKFTEKMMISLGNESHIKDRISGVFVEISSIEESEQKEIIREEEELIFQSTHRELLNIKPTSALSFINDDTFISPTPVTVPTFSPTPIIPTFSPTPVTIPTFSPTPTVVTVPATNPVSVMPTNPTTTPITIPSTNPIVTNPITVPSANPVNPPSTVPGAFPITTPITVPGTSPATNPVTTYPGSPPTNIPITNPVTPPTMSSPVVSGQTWCVAKTGAMETALQAALDYACGVGSVDCSVLQSSGSCYNPNTLQTHASYAFNSYYQKNPVPTSCDFGGAAMIVNYNPSTGSCVYPSSSSSTTIPPATASTGAGMGNGAGVGAGAGMGTGDGTGTGSYGSMPPILNTSDPNSPPYNFGSQPPSGLNSTSDSMAAGLQPLLTSIILAVSFVTGKLIMYM